MLSTHQLFDLNHSLAGSYLAGFDYPWQALKGIKDLILKLGSALGEEYTEVTPTVWVPATAPSSAVLLWWVKTAWWAILWN